MQTKFSILTYGYRPGRRYAELFAMFRRALLGMDSFLLVDVENGRAPVIRAMIMGLTFSLIHIRAQPYDFRENNLLNKLELASLTIWTFSLALLQSVS